MFVSSPRSNAASALRRLSTRGRKDVTLGVDLGTTNSQGFVVKPGKRAPTAIKVADGVIPSAALYSADGECTEVGDRAVRAFENPGASLGFLLTDAKRMLARGTADLPTGLRESANCLIEDDEHGYACYVLARRPSEAPGAKRVKPQAVLAEVLRRVWVLAQTKLTAAETVRKVVIAVPHGYSKKARELTLEAAESAGIPGDTVELIPEPVAASLTWAWRHGDPGAKHDHTLLVADVGGGTTDVTILRGTSGPRAHALPDNVKVIATAGDPDCGGRDADSLFEPLVRRKCAFQEIDEDVPEVLGGLRQAGAVQNVRRMALGRSWMRHVQDTKIGVCQVAAGGTTHTSYWTNRNRGRPATFVYQEYATAVQKMHEGVAQVVKTALAGAIEKGELKDEAGQHGLDVAVLVGGASGDPGVREAVAGVVGDIVELDLDVNEAVAEGAAWYAWTRKERPDWHVEDVVPMDVGIEIKLNGRAKQRKIWKCIPANTPVSAAVFEDSETFSTYVKDQPYATFNLYVSPPGGLAQTTMPFATSRLIAKGTIENLPRGPKGLRFAVKLSVDHNMRITLTANMMSGGEPLTLSGRIDDVVPAQASPVAAGNAVRSREAGASGRSSGRSPGRARTDRSRPREESSGPVEGERSPRRRLF